MRVYASVLYCLLGSSALFSVAVFALLPSISAGLGYGDHPEYIGMMAGIVAVDAFVAFRSLIFGIREKHGVSPGLSC